MKQPWLIFSGLLALAAATATQTQFVYTTNEGTIIITGYTGPAGAVAIPTNINGRSVTGIGNYAFASNSGLTNVTIPSSVTSIPLYAFYICSSVASITIPASVTNLGN